MVGRVQIVTKKRWSGCHSAVSPASVLLLLFPFLCRSSSFPFSSALPLIVGKIDNTTTLSSYFPPVSFGQCYIWSCSGACRRGE